MLLWGLLVSQMSFEDLSEEVLVPVAGWCVKSMNNAEQYMGYSEDR